MTTALATLSSRTGPKPMARHICLVEGCEAMSDHPVSGVCHMHYMRIRRKGSTDTGVRTRGTGTVTTFGYIAIAKNGKKKQAHVLAVEAVLGHALPFGAEVHHVNENKSDNTLTNLVVCPSRAYHKLLHQRKDALDACGNPNYRKCPFCKQYSEPETMTHSKHGRHYYHAACKTAYGQNWRTK